MIGTNSRNGVPEGSKKVEEPSSKRSSKPRTSRPRAKHLKSAEEHSSYPVQPHVEPVDVRPLKEWCRRNLPENSPLRSVILVEDEYIPSQDLVGRVKVWLRLLRESSLMPLGYRSQ
jgi:hypothetical protein